MAPPSVFSSDFHLRFFPAVIRRRLQPSGERSESPFAHHIAIEYPLMLALAIVLASVGLPSMVVHHSVGAGILGVIGMAGAVALVWQSIYAERGARPTFEAFRIGVFLFFVTLGLTTGLLLGVKAHSHFREVLGATAGLALGYALGIVGGLWVQRLGWISAWVELAGGLSVVGLVVVDLVMMFG